MTPLDEALQRFEKKLKDELDMFLFNWGIIPDGQRQTKSHSEWQKRMYIALTAILRSIFRSELERARKEERERIGKELKSYQIQIDVVSPSGRQMRNIIPVQIIDDVCSSLTDGKEQP